MNPSTSPLAAYTRRFRSRLGFAKPMPPPGRGIANAPPCKFNFAMFPGTSGPSLIYQRIGDFHSPLRPPHRREFDNPRTEELHYSVSLERRYFADSIYVDKLFKGIGTHSSFFDRVTGSFTEINLIICEGTVDRRRV